MKNVAIAAQASSPGGWGRGAAAASTATCGAAARPSARAAPTAPTSASSRAGPAHAGLDPEDVDYPWLRRYAAASGAATGAAPSTRGAQARLAARLLPRAVRARRDGAPTPPTCCRRPSRRSGCRGRSRPPRSRALLDRIPADTPLELRDRALFELAYALRAARRGARQPRRRRRSTSTREQRAGGGQGRQDALRARAASPRCARSTATWSAARPHAGRPTAAEPALFLSKSGRRLSTSDVRRRLRAWARHAAAPGRRASARAAPLLRDPSARGRGGPPRHPGAARPLRRISTTQVYTRVESARLRAAYARSHPRA